MIYCIKRNWRGANGPNTFGYRLVTKIRSSFIKGPVTEDTKTRSWGFLTKNWNTIEGSIAQIVEHYFQHLFTSSNPEDIEGVLNSVDRRVTPSMNASILQRYTPEEVRKALFQMHPSKSPDPDGMSPFFFQKFWHIVGHDVTTVVLLVLNSGHMLRKMNHTHIVLIPKKNDRTHMMDYRP